MGWSDGNKRRSAGQTCKDRCLLLFILLLLLVQVPNRTSEKALNRTELVAEYQMRRQRALDLFCSEMEGFEEVVGVVREQHEVERGIEGIYDMVESFNEAKIEKARAEGERRKYEEEKRLREEAEAKAEQFAKTLREYEEKVSWW